MNFLAHLYLSGDDDHIKIGNFIGDFVKGNPHENYSGKIAQGIVLHREIDRFTDTHPISQESKRRLSSKYRHYAGVIVDIYYDHFLATHWSTFSKNTLAEFAEDSYELMRNNEKFLPKKAKLMLPYMISGNWLLNYMKFEGIQKTLSGMAQRTPFESKMEEAVVDLKKHYPLFEEEFLTFFADIIEHTKKIYPHVN